MERENIMIKKPLINIPENWNLTEEQLWKIFELETIKLMILKMNQTKKIRKLFMELFMKHILKNYPFTLSLKSKMIRYQKMKDLNFN